MASSSGNDRSDPPMAAKDHDPWKSLSLLSHQYESAENHKRGGSLVSETDQDVWDAWDEPSAQAVHKNRLASLPDPPAQAVDENRWASLPGPQPQAVDENRWASWSDPPAQAVHKNRWTSLSDPPAQAVDENRWAFLSDPPAQAVHKNQWASFSDPPAQAADKECWETWLDPSAQAMDGDFWQNWVEETEWETWTEPPVLPSTNGESAAIYKTKLIEFLGRSTPIILQKDNGPCPLIAICNVLLLRGAMDLGKLAVDITHENLVSLLAARIMESSSNVEGKDEVLVRQQEQDIMDALDIVPNLVKGLDVNVKFRRINDFEFTRECAIFDVLSIGLCHGWIVDPQDTDTVEAIGSDSYNTLVDKVVAFEMGKIDEEEKGAVDTAKLEQSMSLRASLDNTKDAPCPGFVSSSEKSVAQVSDRDEISHQPEVDQQKGQLIKHFLENNASQLTYYGLFCLQEGLKELELSVFFRNNHFSTIFKHKGQLYVLATDQGYIDKPDLVWEKLNEINGDTVFVNANFGEYKDENQLNHSGTKQSSMTSTTDYLTTFNDSSPSASHLRYAA